MFSQNKKKLLLNLLNINKMKNNLVLLTVTFLTACLASTEGFVPSALQTQVKTDLASTASDRSYLYRKEPTDVERKVMEEEAKHDVKHSTYHVEKGPMSLDDKNDPLHSVHHHLIEADHDKLHDLELRAQNAWLPVNVHEVDVDGVSAAAALFGMFALILLLVGIAQ
jgi:hypothetical protein